MSPKASAMLVETIMPIIVASVPRVVKPVGGEDAEEITQDTIASAAQMLEACEQNNQPLIAKSIAYYSIQRAKSGRRSYSAGRTDAMSPGTQLDGLSSVESLDNPFAGGGQDDEDPLCLHDVLACEGEDPGQVARRRIDWECVLDACTPRQRAIIKATAEGEALVKLAARYHVSPPAITFDRQNIGRHINEAWGCDGLAAAVAEPAWRRGMRCIHERGLAQAERRKANEV